MECSKLFSGKKVTVMGLGLLGRGVGDAEFLAECGAQVLVTDMKSAVELVESVDRLQKYPNVSFRLGGHAESDFIACDMVVKAAGVPIDSPYIAAARKAGVQVYMSTALFARYAMEAGATIIGVTGTRGKTTVTQMIYESLKIAGKPVLLGGNIRGVSTLALLPEVSAESILVLELDSWQLQGFGDLAISPQIAVFTNLMFDHQNYYPDMDAYFSDKANIFRNQHEGDTLVCGKGVADRIIAAHPVAAPHIGADLPPEWELKIPGEHNRENAALAAEALRALKMPEREIRSALEAFAGVEGRLQFVRELHGVRIYNDNNATTPEATIAALKALDSRNNPSQSDSAGHGKNIILIAGGADKGLNLDSFLPEVAARAKKVILISGTGTARIVRDLPDAHLSSTLAGAVNVAIEAAQPGDIVLFSPAFASFGMFKNEYDRNDQFLSVIQGLQ